MTALFMKKAPGVMRLLMSDFGITTVQAAAILGNLGHECAGFEKLQEITPTVPGSRGGYGWPQWTGSRRRAYEAYCRRNGYNPASDEANYKYLWLELKGLEGTEGDTIPKLKRTDDLRAAVRVFEQEFLRAGVKHYESRYVWAERALKAWNSKPDAPPMPLPKPSIWARIAAWFRRLFSGD